MLKRLWHKLSNLGVEYKQQGSRQLSRMEAKHIRTMNQILMASILAIGIILLTVATSEWSLGHPLNIYTQIIMVVTMLMGLHANYRQWFALTKSLFLLVGPTYVVLSSMGLGRETSYHFYLVLTLMLPFAIHSVKEKWWIIAGVAYNFAAFIFIHWWYENYTLPGLPADQVKTSYYMAILFLSGLVTLCVYYFFIGNARAEAEIEQERTNYEGLLLNILPKDVVKELNERGSVKPVSYDSVTVLFTDFAGFTMAAEKMNAQELVNELDQCFSYFDTMMERFNLEKLKTIGDSYMCAGGIPSPNTTHAVDCVMAAFEIQSFMNKVKELRMQNDLPYWELRVGIHTGPLVAGVIGEKKFAYDVWGDTVNTASRLESAGMTGRINISQATYELVKDFFDCEYRGRVKAKSKGEIAMYFALGLKDELTEAGDEPVPNDEFKNRYLRLEATGA